MMKKLNKKYLVLICVFTILFFVGACTSVNTPLEATKEIELQVTETKATKISPTAKVTEAVIPTQTPQVETSLDIENETYTIYHIGDLTSRFASAYAPAIRGVEDWALQINSEGGILGGSLELHFSETEGEIEQAVLAFEKILAEDDNPLAIIVYKTKVAEAIIPIATFNNIPVINLGTIPVQQDYLLESYLFNFYVPYDQQLGFFLNYVNENWVNLNPERLDTGIRLAFFAWDDQFGRSALTKENRELIEELRIELVFENYFLSSSVENISNPISQAWGKGANVIYTNSYFHGPGILLNDLNRLGIQDFMLIAGPSAAMDIRSYSFLEFNTYLNGFIAPYPFAWYSDENNPAIDKINENLENASRTIADKSQQRIIAQGALDLLIDSIKITIAKNGIESLNSETIYQTMAALENYQVMGGLFEVDFSNRQRTLSGLHMRQVNDFLEFLPLD